METKNFLLLDDEVLIREGLRSLLEKEPFVGSIYEAGNAIEFQLRLKEEKIDFVLLDIRLRDSNGMGLLEYAKKHYPSIRIIAVTGMEGVELIINMLKAGIDGIVYKLDGYCEILKTIKSIMASGNYFPERILKIIQSNARRWAAIPTVVLTNQELDILRAIARGSITKEIATELKMTEATAETYRVRLAKKVGVSNTAGLMAYAYRNGIL